MDRNTAKYLTTDLMNRHGLYGWVFKWNHAKLIHGRCHYGIRKITLSKYFVDMNDEDCITQTILHEIAHALVGPRRNSHDFIWKAKAREIGVRRPAPAKHSNMPTWRYTASCPNCGPLKGGKHRLSKKHTFSCVRCKSEIVWNDTKDLALIGR